MTGCTSGGYDQLETSPEIKPIIWNNTRAYIKTTGYEDNYLFLGAIQTFRKAFLLKFDTPL